VHRISLAHAQRRNLLNKLHAAVVSQLQVVRLRLGLRQSISRGQRAGPDVLEADCLLAELR
jgi:hypothetical protein